MSEPDITINLYRLTDAQAMAVRVAITNFHSELSDPESLGDDQRGRDLAAAYRNRLQEVLRIMNPPTAQTSGIGT